MAKQQQQNRSNQNQTQQGNSPRSQKMTGSGFSQLSRQWDRSRSQ